MIIHMVLFKFEEPVSADFEETVAYHCEQIRQHCEGVILFDLKKNFSDRSGGFVYALSSIFKDVEVLITGGYQYFQVCCQFLLE